MVVVEELYHKYCRFDRVERRFMSQHLKKELQSLQVAQ